MYKRQEQFQNGYSGFERFLEILSIAPDIADEPDAVSLKEVKGAIEFKKVSFYYENESEKVLDKLDLKVEAGDYIALVGPSGVAVSYTHLDVYKRQLKDLAKARKMKGVSAMKKSGLIDAMLAPDEKEKMEEARAEAKEEVKEELKEKKEGTDIEQLDSGKSANGILEVLPDGYGFIRCENYLPGRCV